MKRMLVVFSLLHYWRQFPPLRNSLRAVMISLPRWEASRFRSITTSPGFLPAVRDTTRPATFFPVPLFLTLQHLWDAAAPSPMAALLITPVCRSVLREQMSPKICSSRRLDIPARA